MRETLAARPSNIKVHETTDPEVIVAEFAYAGTNLETGKAFPISGGLANLLSEIGKHRSKNE